MTPIPPVLAVALGFAFLAVSTAASADDATPSSGTRTTGEWTVGIGALAVDSPYAGEGTRVRPVPLIGYEGERAFVRGTAAGVHLFTAGLVTVDALVSARLDGFDIDDLGRSALLAHGLDAALLDDRDDGLDAGFRATLGANWGALSLEAVHDVTDASGGYEVALDYRYSWLPATSVVTATVGSRLLSSDLAGYYYGTLDAEVARGVVAYTPGAAVVHRVGVTVVHPLGATWHLVGSFDYQRLPGALADSPLLDPGSDGVARVVVGVSRRF